MKQFNTSTHSYSPFRGLGGILSHSYSSFRGLGGIFILIFLFTLLAGQLTAQPVGKDRISLKHGAHGDKRTDAFM
ncbi:MAG: hypothetical protein LBT25_01230, partial [Candidatus Symbiothrix sp.]|nr:hypothetical protein [Candidatus Symbiothrix sp.]